MSVEFGLVQHIIDIYKNENLNKINVLETKFVDFLPSNRNFGMSYVLDVNNLLKIQALKRVMLPSFIWILYIRCRPQYGFSELLIPK